MSPVVVGAAVLWYLWPSVAPRRPELTVWRPGGWMSSSVCWSCTWRGAYTHHTSRYTSVTVTVALCCISDTDSSWTFTFELGLPSLKAEFEWHFNSSCCLCIFTMPVHCEDAQIVRLWELLWWCQCFRFHRYYYCSLRASTAACGCV